MPSHRRPIFTALLIGGLTGLGYPFLDVAWACRLPDSEACVWGKAYFPLTVLMSVIVVGGVAAGLAYAFLTWRRSRHEDHDAV